MHSPQSNLSNVTNISKTPHYGVFWFLEVTFQNDAGSTMEVHTEGAGEAIVEPAEVAPESPAAQTYGIEPFGSIPYVVAWVNPR